jgi:glucan phosphoethanolaminetransferase (alkaline phosphatase superfamily)
MSALQGLFGFWVLAGAAFIELYARRYAYSGTPLLPHGALAALALAILLLPPRLAARAPWPRERLRAAAVAVVCAAALLLAAQRSLQLVHVALVAGLFAAVLAALAPLLRAPAPWWRFACALALATLSFALLAYYAILVVGLEMWNEIVSRELLWTYARQLPDLVAAMPVSAWIPWTAGAGLFLALFLAYWLAAPGLGRDVLALGRRVREAAARAGSMRRARKAALLALLACALALAHSAARVVAHGQTPDPLVVTFFVEQGPKGTPNMPFQPDPAHDALERAAAARYAPPAGVERRPLVLITVDALRADQMNVYGHPRPNTPFLSRLRREGRLARFDNVFSACTESQCGLLAILAARQWHELGTGRQRFGLADVLKRLGYRNHFLLGGDHTNFYGLRSYYGDNVDEYIDGASSSGYMNDDAEVIGWLERMDAAGGGPHFIYIHLMSVHFVGKRLPKYRVWYRTRAGARDPAGCCSPRGDYADKYHDGILQVDGLLEDIFRILKAKGLLDDALVAITSDHGELIGDGGKFGHGGPPVDALVRVPLLLYDARPFAYPPQPLASVVDVAPTLLARIGAPIPEHWSGRPLDRPGARRFALVQSRDRFAIVGEFGGVLYKYYQFIASDAWELARLAGPGEEQPVSAPRDHARVLGALRAELEKRVPSLRRGR